MSKSRTFWVISCGLLVSQILLAGSPKTATDRLTIKKTDETIVIDGKVTEQAWENALHLQLNYEVRPGENIKPPVTTDIFMTYDQDNLLIGFRCQDPNPESIRARYTDRDRAWSDDFVGIVLDTFNDERRAFEFMCNPLGVQMDAINDDVGDNYDDSWNAIWKSAGRITESGYEVEMAIPFKQLQFSDDQSQQIWGFDGFRSYPRGDRHHIGFFPRDRGNNSYLSQAAKISGFKGLKQGRNLQIVPTATTFRTDARDSLPDGSFSKADDATDLGVTARWGITPNIVLNATANPDFSQVEADVVKLDINETFSLFFPETRPFFLEGADFFNTDINLVHTRTIADPSGALKLTGKVGNHTFGVFSARDDETNLIFPGSQGSDSERFEFKSTGSVARYRRDFGQNSTVGALVTSREGSGYENRVFSMDTTYRITDEDVFRFNGAFSRTKYTEAMSEYSDVVNESFNGHGLNMSYRHSERNWNARASYADFSEDFRADLGFQTRVDYRRAVIGGGYIWHGKPGTFYNRIDWGGDWDQTETQDGELIERELESWFSMDAGRESELNFGLGQRTRVFEGIHFDQFFQSLSYSMRLNANLFFRAGARHGDWIDFANTREAEQLRLDGRLTMNYGRHLYLNLEYLYDTLDVADGRLFVANVPQLRVIYHFNERLLLRAIMQYTHIDRDPSLFEDEVDEKSEDLFNQFLVSYKINSQTVAFLGYSDIYEANLDYSLTQADRTFFAKLGYAWIP